MFAGAARRAGGGALACPASVGDEFSGAQLDGGRVAVAQSRLDRDLWLGRATFRVSQRVERVAGRRGQRQRCQRLGCGGKLTEVG